ncbi:MAG: DUF1294 domain-containing protein [Candidatus Zophobacter franzmannii]|jgi:uncharacterized membrane protein YsdA (DUF1294 family)|nr:DUF1294 domain-containing protein [Candidatus Zophobacter franzmannii]
MRIFTTLLIIAAVSFGLSFVIHLKPIYLLLMTTNVFTFGAYGIDKFLAIKGYSRIPETVLHTLMFSGGTPSAIVGQWLFRHKTSKKAFRRVFWLLLLAQVILIAAYIWFTSKR